MPGFDPVGSAPVASIGSTAPPGTYFTAATGTLTFAAYAPIVTMGIVPPRVTWSGVEVLNTGLKVGRVTSFVIEVLRTTAINSSFSWVTSTVVEVLHDEIRNALVTSSVAEVVQDGNPRRARLTTTIVEVVRPPPVPGFVFHITD